MSTPTSAFSFQNFYSATLTSDITNSDLTIPLDIAPSISEGVLVIDPDTTNPEVIYFTSKGASSVTCPADGRGWDSTSAVSHLQGTTVICAPVAYYFTEIKRIATTSTAAWKPLGYAPNTVAYNGNRSYTLTFNSQDLTSYISNGMRVQSTRTVTAPTQCTSLNGTTQYYNKTSPAGMTFTDDATAMGWVKLTSYGATSTIMSRYNGTSGWAFTIETGGQVQFLGYNAASANFRGGRSYQSIPLNQWVHVAATLDMSGQTHAIYIDGISVPVENRTGGTNPTALVQAGNLEVGSRNGGADLFPGKLAQVAVFSSVLSGSTILSYASQGLSGSETGCVSAYSFNNSINDLNANANNLTAQGSAAATNADSPFAQDDAGVPTGTTDCGIVQSCTFSTNTTMVVQVPEGCTIPTSGGVTSMQYSTEKVPLGFPSDLGRWTLEVLFKGTFTQSSPVSGTWYNMTTTSGTSGGMRMTFPIGYFKQGWDGWVQPTGGANGGSMYVTLSTANNTESDNNLTARNYIQTASIAYGDTFSRSKNIKLTAQTDYYLNAKTDIGSMSTILFGGTQVPARIYAELANL